jgi:hypothetical protein
MTPAPAASAQPSPFGADAIAELINQRPEVGAAAAFAGGFLLAQILKRLGH